MNKTDPEPTQGRVEELEIKVAYLERNLAELDDVVREMGTENARLLREVKQLAERVAAAAGQGGDVDPERYQVPPHY